MIYTNKQSGVALLSAMLLVTVLLGIVLTLTAVLIPKIRTSAQAKHSVTAVYAADSGLEWCLRNIHHGGESPFTMDNGAIIQTDIGGSIVALDASHCTDTTTMIKIIGGYRGVNRAFEIEL